MTPEEIKQKILSFIKQHQLTVIATVDVENNKPECAVIGFAEQEDLSLIIGTSNDSRKYKNIQKNSHVSFVIGWDGRQGTVQYEGVAAEIDNVERETYLNIIAAKNPFSRKFADRPEQRYFRITPTWIRITDMSTSPNQISEITL